MPYQSFNGQSFERASRLGHSAAAIQAMADRLKLEIVDSRMIGEDHRLLLQPAR